MSTFAPTLAGGGERRPQREGLEESCVELLGRAAKST